MRRLSAHYAITCDGDLLKRPIITVNDEGVITGISQNDTSHETPSTEFYNGIIIAGFVNCHCHLELSGLKHSIPAHDGLPKFLASVRHSGSNGSCHEAMDMADRAMFDAGIEACGDVCNTDCSFDIKANSHISYHNFIEVCGTNPNDTSKRVSNTLSLIEASRRVALPYSVCPHSPYSVCLTLLRQLNAIANENDLVSIHFMESSSEVDFLSHQSGLLADSFRVDGLMPPPDELAKNHIDLITNEIDNKKRLLLVHNTFVTRDIVEALNVRGNIFWCLCPKSNLYIEGSLPPIKMLREEQCEIVIGTDGLSSNDSLSLLEELKTIENHFPEIGLNELITWATLNGAKALGIDDVLGSIAIGKRPGLLLLDNVDLHDFRLRSDTLVKRLV